VIFSIETETATETAVVGGFGCPWQFDMNPFYLLVVNECG